MVSDRFPATLYPYQPFAGESSLDVDKFVDEPPPQDAYAGPAFTFDSARLPSRDDHSNQPVSTDRGR